MSIPRSPLFHNIGNGQHEVKPLIGAEGRYFLDRYGHRPSFADLAASLLASGQRVPDDGEMEALQAQQTSEHIMCAMLMSVVGPHETEVCSEARSPGHREHLLKALRSLAADRSEGER